ncbi:5-aminolevulic acid synthase [Pararhodobacter marinus]|uniref:5-aminolevulic acid synthase n=1 Tax=Pararhodobacter marinus TaxID=2184063 RepID=A0A2U2CGK3_9RHOB|nr:5-aminolevulic acid synthase [Pararhodobacter marinus]PWE31023.1 5-aminolevulic acid synthase [Pararhodobacter marinus]
MSHRPVTALTCALAALTASAAMADPVPSQTAQAMVFPAGQIEIARYDLPGLSEQEINALMTVARSQQFYAAVAYAPDAGILSEPTVMAANYHSPDAARSAALEGCNGRRSGGSACTLALEVRPAGWESRPVMLSADATTGFLTDFAAAPAPRALAISASTGQWGIGTGSAAASDAVSACTGGIEVSDCEVVIAD